MFQKQHPVILKLTADSARCVLEKVLENGQQQTVKSAGQLSFSLENLKKVIRFITLDTHVSQQATPAVAIEKESA
jgi:hypothetical protein